MKNAYAEASAAVSGDAADSAPGGWGMCAAAGCCLPGTMSASTQGPKDWWCRVHFGAPRGEHDSITAHIANRRSLFQLAYLLASGQKGANASSATRDRVRAMGRADLVGGPTMTEYTLGTQMLQALTKECRAPQKHMGVPSSARGASWIDTEKEIAA
jgi:hypothetical protein